MKSLLISQLRTLGLFLLAIIMTCGFNIPGIVAATTDTTNLTQAINAGALSVEFVDASYVTVASPNVTMGAITFSFSSQLATGLLGTNTERLYWENPDAADGGYVVTMAATAGTTSCWDLASGGSCAAGDYDFNDVSGATDGVDADSLGGQLTVDPSVGTLTARTGTTTGMTKGSSTAFNEGTVDSITLVTAAAGADDITRTYITGVSLSQNVPAMQGAGSYTVNMTVTIT